jgi:hypothetical protein
MGGNAATALVDTALEEAALSRASTRAGSADGSATHTDPATPTLTPSSVNLPPLVPSQANAFELNNPTPAPTPSAASNLA